MSSREESAPSEKEKAALSGPSASTAASPEAAAEAEQEAEEMLPLRPDRNDSSSSGSGGDSRVSSPRPVPLRSSARRASFSARAERAAVAALWHVVGSHTLGWDRRLRWTNTILALLGLLNFVVVLLLYQSCWDSDSLRFDLEPANCAAFLPLRTVAHIAWAAFIGVLIHYYHLKATFQSLVAHYPSKGAAFFGSELCSSFCIELLLSLVQPFPLLYFVLDLHRTHYLVLLALLAKVYLLFRVLRDWSEVYQERFNIKQRSRSHNNFYTMDFATVIKCYAYYHTAAVVGIGVFLNLLIMAYQMHLCERELWLPRDAHTGLTPARFDDIDSARLQLPHHGEPILIDANGNAYYQSPYVSLLNAFYFIGIVSTTTGLGDVAPVTNQGKIFAVMAAFMGMSWSIFAGGVLTNKLVPSDFQSFCIDFLERQKIDRTKRHLAAMLIQRTWRLYRSLKLAEARGGPSLSYVERAAKFRTTLLPVLRQYQSVQRQEASTHWIFADHTETIAKGGARPKGMPDVAVAERERERRIDDRNAIDPSRMGNAALARELELRVAAHSASSPTSPLAPHAQRQSAYGSTEQQQSSSSSGEGLRQRQRVQRSSSTSGVRTPRGDVAMSPGHALRALRNLSRTASVSSASGHGDGGGGSGSGARSPPLLSTGYSSHSSALVALAAQNAALSSSLRALESKLDQLLSATARAGVHENMLERGHVFTSWSSSSGSGERDRSDRDVDAVPVPLLLWLERDGTTYGSLHWTTEEFAVNSRLRIKCPGNSFPLHSITDVLLGKSSAEFNLPSTSSLPSSLCFSVLSKAHPTGLRLQTQYAEERSEWIRQLKQAFMKRTVKSTASGASSATHSAAASPRAAGTTISGAASSDPMSAPVNSADVGSAKKMRRASESSGMGGGGTLGGVAGMQLAQSQSQQGHGRASSFLPSFSTPAESPSPSPLARFKSDT